MSKHFHNIDQLFWKCPRATECTLVSKFVTSYRKKSYFLFHEKNLPIFNHKLKLYNSKSNLHGFFAGAHICQGDISELSISKSL